MAKDYKVLYAVKLVEAETCARLVASQAGTITRQGTLLERCGANVERLEEDRDQWFRRAERRKKAAPWLAAGAFILGVLLGGR